MKRREIDIRPNIRIVTSNDLISAKGLSKLSLYSRKLFLLAIAQCRKSDKEFYYYEINVSDFAKLIGTPKNHIYEVAREISNELMHTTVEIISNPEKRKFRIFTLFALCDYDDARLYFQLNSALTEFLLDLRKDFSQPLLTDFLPMKSTSTMAIWHLIQREVQKIQHDSKDKKATFHFQLTLKEIRIATNAEDKYERISQFKGKVLDHALEELNRLQLAKVSYKDVKSGRFIAAFEFEIRYVGSEYLINFAKQSDSPRKRFIQNQTRFLELKSKKRLSAAEKSEKDALEKELEGKSLSDFRTTPDDTQDWISAVDFYESRNSAHK